MQRRELFNALMEHRIIAPAELQRSDSGATACSHGCKPVEKITRATLLLLTAVSLLSTNKNNNFLAQRHKERREEDYLML